ncbi:hypothetical protein [Gordonia liuliyuniae]|uniref:SipW-cognate class signal peptide n=1 Tax=Gordonia liuliyuniae TaxID=2911517 RepID=A0ABS9IWX7_9ACTN|nr:hypothetical protein [Gordonia liuliyuniae]MCF8589975.1 hypothetical protein [Gordonia liuliyuniae]
MRTRKVLLAAAGILVAVLIFGSVRTTGALWRDQQDGGSETQFHTGALELSPGTSSGSSFTFLALNGENLAPGDARQAELDVTNTGTTPLEFALDTAGPTVQGSGVVTVRLSGAQGACPGAATTDLSGAFIAKDTAAASVGFNSSSRRLAPDETTTWCIRAKLVSVSGVASATFTITFHFAADQVRP